METLSKMPSTKNQQGPSGHLIIKLTEKELKCAAYYLNDRQSILAMLKDKGAPIDGTIYLSVKDGFSLKHELDNYDGSMVFTFIKSLRHNGTAK